MGYWLKRSAVFGALVAAGALLANCENRKSGPAGADPAAGMRSTDTITAGSTGGRIAPDAGMGMDGGMMTGGADGGSGALPTE